MFVPKQYQNRASYRNNPLYRATFLSVIVFIVFLIVYLPYASTTLYGYTQASGNNKTASDNSGLVKKKLADVDEVVKKRAKVTSWLPFTGVRVGTFLGVLENTVSKDVSIIGIRVNSETTRPRQARAVEVLVECFYNKTPESLTKEDDKWIEDDFVTAFAKEGYKVGDMSITKPDAYERGSRKEIRFNYLFEE